MGQTSCASCGAELRENTSFCVRCGTPSAPPASEHASPLATAPAQVLTAQVPIAVEHPANPMRRLVLAGVIALIATLLVRVAISATADPKPQGEIVAQLPVGPEGGKTKIDGGGTLKVPKGALKRRTTLQVRRSTIKDRIRAVSPTGTTIVIPAGAQIIYFFSPANIVFLVPVTISLPLPPPPGQGLVFLSSNGQVTFINGTAGTSVVTIKVNSFNFASTSTIVGGP